MLIYPHINPVAIKLGPLAIHWYGLMYVFGFLFFIYAGKWRIKYYPYLQKYFTPDFPNLFILYGVFGVLFGGRLGYCIFYEPQYFLNHPLEIFKVWDGGMSFHGGLIGVVIAIAIFSKIHKISYLVIADLLATLIPAGLFFGRIGNFINGELWGRITTLHLPWAMIYPQSGNNLPRHPSEIYEALCEGVLLLIIMWIYCNKERRTGKPAFLFIMLYGIMRFVLEYFRAPDQQLAWLVTKFGFSMGQMLSFIMFVIGFIGFIIVSKRNNNDIVIKK